MAVSVYSMPATSIVCIPWLRKKYDNGYSFECRVVAAMGNVCISFSNIGADVTSEFQDTQLGKLV